ncbi:MAG TPA: hypothetical protein DIT13_16235 [Verrucomicrobiales bacterium]|nr:hypothetical protein [Verrucomicrobiales bacterium]
MRRFISSLFVFGFASPVFPMGPGTGGADHFLAKDSGASAWSVAVTQKGNLPDEKLRGLVWRAPGRPQGVIVCLHGLQTHSAWFAPVAADLRNAGWTVIAPDRRDSGMNRQQNMAPVKSAEQLFGDLSAHLEQAAAEAPGKPLILLGTSWGSNLATAYLVRRQDARVSGLIQLVPATQVRKNLAPKFAERVLGPVLSVLSPRMPARPTFCDFHYLAGGRSQSSGKGPPAIVDRRAPLPEPPALEDSNSKLACILKKDDSLLREPSIRTLRVGLVLAEMWRKKTSAIPDNTPILILTAGHDQIMDNRGALAAFPQGRVTHRDMPAGHGVQITHPHWVSRHVLEWLRSAGKRP